MRKELTMKPVMLATDGSPTAAKATASAIELARLLGTELVIVTVSDVAYASYSAIGFAPIPLGELASLGQEEAAKITTEAAEHAEEAGIETRAVVLRGFPVEAICDAAERFAPQFLVIGSHGWGAMKRALFGSVSTGVLHHAKCPVLVVRGVTEQTASAENGARETAGV
jgi:nucleotide-binding universal stress UspA family protein